MMLRVGVTGGIGSGKTLVCEAISALGYPVFNADIEARAIVDTHPLAIEGYKQIFGAHIYAGKGLDRLTVARQLFACRDTMERVSQLIHPLVFQRFNQWVGEQAPHSLVFVEAAILFESGMHRQVDRVIVVWAPRGVRMQRVVARDGLTPQQVKERMMAQLPQSQIVSRAHHRITNDGHRLVLPQLIRIIGELNALAGERGAGGC